MTVDELSFLLSSHLTSAKARKSAKAWKNRLVPNRERSTSRLYIVTLLI